MWDKLGYNKILENDEFSLSPDALAKFAIDNELRLLQSKLDRIISLLEKKWLTEPNERILDLEKSLLYRRQENEAYQAMVTDLQTKLKNTKEKQNGRPISNSRTKRKSTLDKFQSQTDCQGVKKHKLDVDKLKNLLGKYKLL